MAANVCILLQRIGSAVVLRCHCNCSHHLICARRVPPSAYSTSMTHKTLGPPPPHSPSPQTSVAVMCMLTSLLPSLHQQSLHSRGANQRNKLHKQRSSFTALHGDVFAPAGARHASKQRRQEHCAGELWEHEGYQQPRVPSGQLGGGEGGSWHCLFALRILVYRFHHHRQRH